MWVDTIDQLLTKGQRRNKGRTNLALKYSDPVGTLDNTSHRILKSSGKLGLTPISSPLPPSITKHDLTNYQKRRYYGFSAAELQELGVMSGLENEQMEFGLTNPIYPMYVRSQWESRSEMPWHKGPVPIRGDEDEYWLAENPRVWDILEPSLRLASLLLTNANHYPWWDALFNGSYRDIDSNRISSPFDDPANVLVSFHQRIPEQCNAPEAVSLLQTRLVNAAQKIKFRLFSGYKNANTGCTMNENWYYGDTITEIWNGIPPTGTVRVNIALELLQTLLRDDLTGAEKI